VSIILEHATHLPKDGIVVVDHEDVHRCQLHGKTSVSAPECPRELFGYLDPLGITPAVDLCGQSGFPRLASGIQGSE
jgi:hypothetical protein